MSHFNDMALAFDVHNRLNNRIGITENAIIAENDKGEDYRPRTLIDNTLELIDPTPNIHTLFVQFNTRYFWNKLLPVEVKWSNRMTTCAGVCSFHPRNRQCVITLSAPLLKLRPRKDLVETLLHEMIHGYLFLTNNDRDRDGHGPEFHKHMYRINKEAGTHITVYHDFHDEVRLYQQHWWVCDGPCKTRAPFFGTVRRAMNRAPGPNDRWWSMHQQTCGGQFKKIREPEKKQAKGKNSAKENDKKLANIPKSKDISNWFTKIDKPKKSTAVTNNIPLKATSGKPTVPKVKDNSIPPKTGSTFTKLGNTSNNIHGWGVGGPSGSAASGSSSTPQAVTKVPKFYAAGVLGGSGTGRSNLLDRYASPNTPGTNKSTKISQLSNSDRVLGRNNIVDLTGTPNKRKSNDPNSTSAKLPKIEAAEDLPKKANCPVCNTSVEISALNDHLDECLMLGLDIDKNQSTPKMPKSSKISLNDSTEAGKINIKESPIVISDSSGSEEFQSPRLKENRQKCLVCNALIDPEVTLNDHLEDCIGAVFSDNSFPEFEDKESKTTDNNEVGDKNFPCPVCMAFIEEPLMSNHLFICLNKDVLEK